MKNTKEIATEYQMGQWAEVMRDRATSGLNIRAYCRREGIHPNRYHYWQRKLRETAINTANPKFGLLRDKAETIAPVPAGWTQVTAIEDENINNESIADKTTASSEVTIEIGKCRVTAKDDTNTELLSKVFKVLVNLC